MVLKSNGCTASSSERVGSEGKAGATSASSADGHCEAALARWEQCWVLDSAYRWVAHFREKCPIAPLDLALSFPAASSGVCGAGCIQTQQVQEAHRALGSHW
eukprot:667352-Rhodomonas_salina.3